MNHIWELEEGQGITFGKTKNRFVYVCISSRGNSWEKKSLQLSVDGRWPSSLFSCLVYSRDALNFTLQPYPLWSQVIKYHQYRLSFSFLCESSFFLLLLSALTMDTATRAGERSKRIHKRKIKKIVFIRSASSSAGKCKMSDALNWQVMSFKQYVFAVLQLIESQTEPQPDKPIPLKESLGIFLHNWYASRQSLSKSEFLNSWKLYSLACLMLEEFWCTSKTVGYSIPHWNFNSWHVIFRAKVWPTKLPEISPLKMPRTASP